MKLKCSSLICLLISFFVGTPLFATEEIQINFKNHYEKKFDVNLTSNPLINCGTCHTPATSGFLNSYGQALKYHELNFNAVENFDSDRDNMTNGFEIEQISKLAPETVELLNNLDSRPNLDQATLAKLLKISPPGSQSSMLGIFEYKTEFGTNVKFGHNKHIKVLATKGKNCDTCHSPGKFKKFMNDTKITDDNTVSIAPLAHGECNYCHFNEKLTTHIERETCQFCHKNSIGSPR